LTSQTPENDPVAPVVAERVAPPRLIRLAELEELLGIKKSQIFLAVDAGLFPPPVRVLPGGRAIAWVADEITQYLAERIAARDREPRPFAYDPQRTAEYEAAEARKKKLRLRTMQDRAYRARQAVATTTTG
jgi:prophage regulatory protein